MKKYTLWLLLFTLSAAFGIAACTPEQPLEEEPTPTFTVTPTSFVPSSTAAPTATPTPVASGSQATPTPASTPFEISFSNCPEVDMIYQLDYTHKVVQHMPNAHFEHIAEPGAAFLLTMHGDGTVDSDDFENLVSVSISGTFEDCVLEGQGELSADIQGICVESVATLLITEHWEAISTIVTCPGREPQSTSMEGFFSAPESEFDFMLTEEVDTQVLEVDTEFLSVYYSWTLHESGPPLSPFPED